MLKHTKDLTWVHFPQVYCRTLYIVPKDSARAAIGPELREGMAEPGVHQTIESFT